MPVTSFAKLRAPRLSGLTFLTTAVFALVRVPAALAQWRALDGTELASDASDAERAPAPVDVGASVGDSLFGKCGALLARFVPPALAAHIAVMATPLGDSATLQAGVSPVREANGSPGFHFVTMRPFADKVAGRIGVYLATSAHGPFVHIDVNGTAARWGQG